MASSMSAGGVQLLARVAAAALSAQPFTVEEVSAGEFGARGGRAQMTDRLTVQALGRVALAQQRAGACLDSQAQAVPDGV